MTEGKQQGESALLLVVPEVKDFVGPYRLKYDPGASIGIPAHITILFPFLPPEKIGEEELGHLSDLFNRRPSFKIRFEKTARFADVLYLAPVPAEPIVALTKLVSVSYPDYPPYGGIHPKITPHLTIASLSDNSLLQRLDEEVTQRAADELPIESVLREIVLYEKHKGRWSPRHIFPFAN
ncbi:MAG: 2'-5' RNA ligase family protein [Chloroflexi bacterium]|nr:2'-5' RNA ligase family protein [Chloroflexota bacterium]MQC26376.1 2'-5' RNA ligase family protein [Chloroflexota bacterium]